MHQTLSSPLEMRQDLPCSPSARAFVERARLEIDAILDDADDRLLLIVGPCSIHNVAEAHEFARRLKVLANSVVDEVLVVYRAYVEKPRSTIGWKGLINDPHLNGSCDIESGLRLARQLYLDLVQLRLPIATESLDPNAILYYEDLIGWAAIGARTSESQTHRELASRLQCPVGFKNTTSGQIQPAIDAMIAAGAKHTTIGSGLDGRLTIVTTNGNTKTNLVLRGSSTESNFDASWLRHTEQLLQEDSLRSGVVVDCSHGNSRKDHRNQAKVAQAVSAERAAGRSNVRGLMLEANLRSGNQPMREKDQLQFGVSITDACIGWEECERLILELARKNRHSHSRTSAPTLSAERLAAG